MVEGLVKVNYNIMLVLINKSHRWYLELGRQLANCICLIKDDPVRLIKTTVSLLSQATGLAHFA